ncbi:Paraquat-inducible protein B [hydrothermal vent metagenome]|uniref:Paraquat-inducible protein B n=1 Tax=hydrothermal vent metagenome TaxID=652676 RepID=A0A3B0XW61_9ZZZZ
MIDEIPEAEVKNSRFSFSAVWVIPLIAAIIGGWLVFKSAMEENTFVEVAFKSASGLEAGKTTVKLRNVKVGDVKDVRFSKDLSKVIVVIEFTGIPKERITETTRFWVIRPRIGISGVSGLDTLLSGAYIEIDPGEGGKLSSSFTGYEEPQNYQLGNPGTTFVLSANKLGSLSRGSSIFLKGIEVGKVTRYALVEDHSQVEIEVFIRSPHDQYVKENTRFWNTSGFEIELGAKGLKLDTESLAAIISGGVSFSNEYSRDESPVAAENTLFRLYEAEHPDIEEVLTVGVPMKLYFDKGVSGLSVGAPVEYKGLRIGTVTEIAVESNKNKTDVLTFAIVDIEPERLPSERHKGKALTKKEKIKRVHVYLEGMVKNGMRAQLKSNLITGQSLIMLDTFPALKMADIKYDKGLFIIPTAPETISGILEQLNQIMAKVEAIPFDNIGNKLEEATTNLNDLIKSLNAAEGGMTGVQAGEMMEELTKAARSIRSMSEYLERHPESLLKGKK